MSEAALVRRTCKALNELPYTRAVKIHASIYGRRGDPDIWGCSRGRMFVLEAKLPGGKPTVHQGIELRRWSEAGAAAGWFVTASDAVEFVRSLQSSRELARIPSKLGSPSAEKLPRSMGKKIPTPMGKNPATPSAKNPMRSSRKIQR